jgi:hypothetical protein
MDFLWGTVLMRAHKLMPLLSLEACQPRHLILQFQLTSQWLNPKTQSKDGFLSGWLQVIGLACGRRLLALALVLLVLAVAIVSQWLLSKCHCFA